MSRLMTLVVVMLALAAPAVAQQEVFQKVMIRSTANDALVVLGQGTFIATTNAPYVVAIRNQSNGTAAVASLKLGSDIADDRLELRAFSSGFTGAVNVASIQSRATGGLDIVQTGSPNISIYTNSSTLAARFNSTGQGLFSNGALSTPGIAFINEPTSGFYWSNLELGGFNVAVGSTKVGRFSQNGYEIPAIARGTGGIPGGAVIVGRNTSGNGAPGQIALEAKNGAGSAFIFTDTTGVIRVATSYVTEFSGDLVGTIVGTQTSSRASKNIEGEVTSTTLAMDIIRHTPVYRFTYKDGRYNGETFFGIVTDDSPLFGMDAGRSFNPVTAFGATVLALRDLDARLRAIEVRR